MISALSSATCPLPQNQKAQASAGWPLARIMLFAVWTCDLFLEVAISRGGYQRNAFVYALGCEFHFNVECP